jgi:hypothetical protein
MRTVTLDVEIVEHPVSEVHGRGIEKEFSTFSQQGIKRRGPNFDWFETPK